jgi:hypothetical protein
MLGTQQNAPVEHDCSPGRWAELGLSLFATYNMTRSAPIVHPEMQ